VQLERAHQEFLKAHRREYGVAASWIVRRLIENQMATGRDLLGKPLKSAKQRRGGRRAAGGRSTPAHEPAASA